MNPAPNRAGGPRLHLTNESPDPFVRPHKAFAVDLGGEARIVLAIKTIRGRFVFYQTEFPIAIATYLTPPTRRFLIRLRWNQCGDSFDLERMFGHKGRPARLEAWAPDLQLG